jgi:hypothetical protein
MEEHKCDHLPSGAYLYKDQLSSCGKNVWYFSLIREATEEDLEESHYLEEVGEAIWTVSAEVLFCPYCGKDLYSGQPNESTGDFVLYDSSAYKMSKR